MHNVEKTISDIKSLKIQGARNIAKIALENLLFVSQESKNRTIKAFVKELERTSVALSSSRPTEPMMRNILEEAVCFARTDDSEDVEELKKAFAKHVRFRLMEIEKGAKKLAEYGARIIPDGGVVLTHCHSSTTTSILIEAKKMKKKFSVVSFETRPRYQGRITASELARAGIDVTATVDGAMNLFMKKADIVIVGADAITSRGDLINKIGTSTLAHIAKMNDVSFYSAAELYKYSPMTIFGTREEIEERDSKEVWEAPPKKVKIRNPAFEATAAKYINGYITELGVIPPQSFFTLASEKLGIKLYK